MGAWARDAVSGAADVRIHGVAPVHPEQRIDRTADRVEGVGRVVAVADTFLEYGDVMAQPWHTAVCGCAFESMGSGEQRLRVIPVVSRTQLGAARWQMPTQHDEQLVGDSGAAAGPGSGIFRIVMRRRNG